MGKASPANITLLVGLWPRVSVWVLIWRTRLGYEIRAYGHSEMLPNTRALARIKIIMIRHDHFGRFGRL